jgi:hypothetical protein
VFLDDDRIEDKKERDERVRGNIIMRNWDLENFVCE